MKLKKMTALMLSAAMITGMLAGCGGSKSESTGSDSAATEDSASADGKVNLKFYIWSDEENYMKEVAENYNKSQDKVSVEVISIANDSYDDKLKVMLSAGSDADIVDIRTLNQVQQFKASGAILDLTDKVKDSDLDISKYGSMWMHSIRMERFMHCLHVLPAGCCSTMKISSKKLESPCRNR